MTSDAPRNEKRGIQLSPAERQDGERAEALARACRLGPLFPIMVWCLRHRPGLEHSPELPDCVEDYLARAATGLRRPQTLNAYGGTLKRFQRAFGAVQLSKISADQIAAHLQPCTNPYTRNHRRQILATFFAWAKARGYVLTNPVTSGVPKPVLARPVRHVLTPEQARWLLQRAMPTDTIGFWSLGMFGGLRTAELRRWQRLADPWSIVRWQAGVLNLPGEVTKTGPRIVPLLPVLKKWLHWLKRNQRPFAPKNVFEKTAELRRELMQQCGKDKVAAFNLGRRSYISHRLALGNTTYREVAEDVGNSEEVLRHYYRRNVNRTAAEEYFSCEPNHIDSDGPIRVWGRVGRRRGVVPKTF